MSEEVARELAAELGWTVMQDGNRGWRRADRVAAAGAVIEAPIIDACARRRDDHRLRRRRHRGRETRDGELRGVEAVIDKDRACGAARDRDEGRSADDPDRRRPAWRSASASPTSSGSTGSRWRRRALRAEGHFGAGSMGPKIEAIAQLRQGPPRRARRDHQRRDLRARAARRDRHLDRRLTCGTATARRQRHADARTRAQPQPARRRRDVRARGRDRRRAIASGRSTIGIRRCCASRAAARASRVELWDVPLAGLASILHTEPAGLCIGKVMLKDGTVVLGVLGEPFLCEGQREITAFGGWRAYLAARGSRGADVA